MKQYFPFKSFEEQSVRKLEGYESRNYEFVGELRQSATSLLHSAGVSTNQKFILKVLNWRDSKDINIVDGLTKLTKFLRERNFDCPYPVPCVEGEDMLVVKHTDLVPYISEEFTVKENGLCNNAKPLLVCDDKTTSDVFYIARVFVFVEGELLGYNSSDSPALLHEFGAYIGRMNKEMMVSENAN